MNDQDHGDEDDAKPARVSRLGPDDFMDPGDEDDAKPARVSRLGPDDFMDPGDGLLEGVFIVASAELFEAMNYAEYMRDCCAACALEANGEDGS